MNKPAGRIICFLTAYSFSLILSGQEAVPIPVGNEHFSELMGNSPFLRVLSLEESYELGGIAKVEGKTFVTLQNRQTKKRVTVVSEKENELGIKLVEVTGSDPENVKVKVNFCGEEAIFAYTGNKLIPKPIPGRSDQVQYDKEGRVRTSTQLVKKFHTLSKEQQRIYLKWKEEVQLKARPDYRYSTKRFPFAHRAMDAIKKGQRPERP